MATNKQPAGDVHLTRTEAGQHLPSYDETGTLSPNSQDPYGRDHRATAGKPSAGTDVLLQGGGGQAQSGPRSRWW